MKKTILIFLFFLLGNFLYAQNPYSDFLGAGHNNGITVTTSHNGNANQDGTKSVDGFPVSNPELLADASRFLAQSTMGYDFETIQMAAAMGYESWIDEQFTLPRQSYVDLTLSLEGLMPPDSEIFGMRTFRAGWRSMTQKTPSQLRERMNYSMSQIFVVSAFGSDLFEDWTNLSAGYYDVLGNNAFGNYRQLLGDVSRNTSMGFYLSHLHNPKSDPANNIHPDENYAREVMQLFSIGLYELNNDGTRKLDGNGNFIPTYNNDDIREFAKIFTGFGDGRPDGVWGTLDEGDDMSGDAVVIPMKIYEEWHEQGVKNLLNGQVVPAGQTGLEDFEDAMDNLYNHPNVGPFIGKALIQFLVTSNPSTEYVDRVATAFNDNGQGVRGDFQAVIKAILLDDEARNCTPLNNPIAGKLREPVIRYSQFLRAFNSNTPNGFYLEHMERWNDATGQTPMFSNSVFNFYLPEYQPNGLIASADLFAPVFQIHNSSTSIGFINEANIWLFEDDPVEENDAVLDFSDEIALANDAAALVDRLDILLACGQLSSSTKTIISNAVAQVDDDDDKIDLAIYLILISPDFAILK